MACCFDELCFGVELAGEGAGVEIDGGSEGFGGGLSGTRTEAGQKVPQVKPDVAASRVLASREDTSVTRVVVRSSADGEVIEPRQP